MDRAKDEEESKRPAWDKGEDNARTSEQRWYEKATVCRPSRGLTARHHAVSCAHRRRYEEEGRERMTGGPWLTSGSGVNYV